ncbi:MAG: hypothetical protein OEZ06_28810 [Myxococcales bacterium]|nr:hypothetical protein [Myxococcales bacterium]
MVAKPGARTLERLHSLLGVLPLGGFLLLHLTRLWPARAGRDAFIAARLERGGAGDAPAWTGALLFMLLLHGGLGFYLRRGRRGAMGALQAATGIAAALFIGYHLWLIAPFAQGPHRGPGSGYDIMWLRLSTDRDLLLHLGGLTLLCFHLGHGLSRLPRTWFSAVAGAGGSGDAQAATTRARLAAGAVAFVLWLGYLELLARFGTGAGLL